MELENSGKSLAEIDQIASKLMKGENVNSINQETNRRHSEVPSHSKDV
jgi:hypothetical protein